MRRGSLLAHVAWPFFVGASCVILRVVCEAISSTNLWCSRRPDVVHPATRFRTWIQRVNLLDSAGFRETAAAPSFWQSSLRPHAVTLSSPPSSPWFCHHVVISIPDDHDLGVENAIKIILGPPLEHGDFLLASRGYQIILCGISVAVTNNEVLNWRRLVPFCTN